MFRYLVVALFVSVAHAQYIAECPPENVEVATFRLMTRDYPPLAVPSFDRMGKDRIYAIAEIQAALADVPDFRDKLELPRKYLTDPFVERCCAREDKYNCSKLQIELRYIKHQDGICWIVWPPQPFVYTRCTCCTCMLDDNCPVIGRCVETDYVTVKVIGYCAHIMYSDRFQKLAIRIPTSCECAASCPLPQTFYYKKIQQKW